MGVVSDKFLVVLVLAVVLCCSWWVCCLWGLSLRVLGGCGLVPVFECFWTGLCGCCGFGFSVVGVTWWLVGDGLDLFGFPTWVLLRVVGFGVLVLRILFVCGCCFADGLFMILI